MTQTSQPEAFAQHQTGPVTRFVVVGSQRTGSTLIRTSLDSHPAIKCSGEVFLFPGSGPESYPRFRSRSLATRLVDLLFRRKLVYRFLDELYARPGYRALGFKFMYSQAERGGTPMVLDYIREHDIPVIHVTRRNLLKTVLSRWSAKQTGVYHARGALTERPRIHLPVSRLIRELQKISRQDEVWSQRLTATPCLSVVYEDFVDDKTKWSKTMLDFLGIDDYQVLGSELKKVNPDSLAQVIENYDEVRTALAGTPYEHCLQ